VKGSILIVDDEASNRELLQDLLTQAGYYCRTASDGESALEHFRHNKPDLVLSDVMMPRLNGYELCRRLKADPENRLIPIVLVTALSAAEDRVRGLEAGADDFLRKPLDRSELLARVRSLLTTKTYTDQLEQATSMLLVLATTVEGRDPYTQGHCTRLSDYSARLASFIGLPEEDIQALRIAGTVHDVGKIAVPDSVLLKPGPLNAEEWDAMRRHPALGADLVRGLKTLEDVLPLIRHHHERMDGSGYPDGLAGEAIPFGARIMAVVDVYDALRTTRPYKPNMSHVDVVRLLHDETDQGYWDPKVVTAFLEVIGEIREPA